MSRLQPKLQEEEQDYPSIVFSGSNETACINNTTTRIISPKSKSTPLDGSRIPQYPPTSLVSPTSSSNKPTATFPSRLPTTTKISSGSKFGNGTSPTLRHSFSGSSDNDDFFDPTANSPLQLKKTMSTESESRRQGLSPPLTSPSGGGGSKHNRPTSIPSYNDPNTNVASTKKTRLREQYTTTTSSSTNNNNLPPVSSISSPTVDVSTASTTSSSDEQLQQQQQKSVHPPVSVMKTLNQLMTIRTNRSCADCKSTLIDTSQVYISYSPLLERPKIQQHYRNQLKRRSITTMTQADTGTLSPKSQQQHYHNTDNFRMNHQAFAPVGGNQLSPKSIATGSSTVSSSSETAKIERKALQIPNAREIDPPIDPALLASTYISGHGVFVCALCGAAHKLLGPGIAVVNAAQDPVAWNTENLTQLIQAGGNARATAILEKYLSPQQDERYRPKASTSIADRLTFVRAKYQTLAFVLPPAIGPLAPHAWDQIVHINYPKKWGSHGWAEIVAFSSLNTLEFTNPTMLINNSGNDPIGLANSNQHHLHNEAGRLGSLYPVGEDTMLLGSSHEGRPTLESANNIMQQRTRGGELPDRLVDHFAVITASEFLDHNFLNEHRGKRMKKQPKSPEDVYLRPTVVDCYPPTGFYDESEECLPEHLATFVFPEGCKPSTVQSPPSFYTFVLTNSSGDRLYGAALRVHDTMYDVEWLRTVFQNHPDDWGHEIPLWLLSDDEDEIEVIATGDEDDDEINRPLRTTKSKGKNRSSTSSIPFDEVFNGNAATPDNNNSSHKSKVLLRHPSVRAVNRHGEPADVIFVPKVFVLLSHYPFFHVWRKFLLQLYRISLTEAPLPIERFIANFVREVPLPPPGKVQVKFGFTIDDTVMIERPPINQLPLANFSFQPLFTTLSVSNVLLVIGCLLQETRVALVSKYYSIFGPVSEALLSLLFPFHWQGMYIPVMPYSMLDILDAPVPYLVGLHSRYLTEVPDGQRPQGVVFVDLDNDVVHLGTSDEDCNAPRRLPWFPERQITKLRTKLSTIASTVYIPPNNQKIGTVTIGAQHEVLSNLERQGSYLHVDSLSSFTKTQGIRRRDVLENTEKAYKDNELLMPIMGFLSEQGQFSERDLLLVSKKTKKFPLLNRHRSNPTRMISSNQLTKNIDETSIHHIHLLDPAEPPGFNGTEIRQAFLRFFVSIFQNYRAYMENGQFRTADFILMGIHGISFNAQKFMESITNTQMFEAFLEDRRSCPDDPEVLFFDESITAKHNRSTKTAISNISMGRTVKKQTTFLDDTKDLITNTYTPPPPSNWGLPYDGRTYCYTTFPRLDSSLFGKTRAPMKWAKPRSTMGINLSISRRSIVFKKEQDFVRKALRFPATATHTAVKKVTKVGTTTVESAIKALSAGFANPRRLKTPDDRSRQRLGSDDGSIISDVTLSSTFEFSQEVMSSAEEVVLNARRKQAILIGIIIKLQAYCRMKIVSISTKRFMDENQRQSLVTFNSAYVARRRNKAATLIQSIYRAAVCRYRFLHIRCVIVWAQTRVRSQHIRLGYILLIGMLSRFQAVIRGHIVRRKLQSILNNRIQLYRNQIFQLWKVSHTPLAFRTKFWVEIQSVSLLRLALAESELHRLWSALNMTSKLTLSSPSTVQESLNIADDCYQKACKFNASLLSESNDSFYNKVTKTKRKTGNASAPADREIAERIQIYERLSLPSTKDSVLEVYLEKFSISSKTGHRKVALAESIWSNSNEVDTCVDFMQRFFPELSSSTDIIFMPPSKKSTRRFNCEDPTPPPLSNQFGSPQTQLQTRIRVNLSVIADAGLRLIPVITLRLSDRQRPRREWATTYRRTLDAIRSVNGLQSTKQAGYFCIKNLFIIPDIPNVPSFSRKLSLMVSIKVPDVRRSAQNPFDEEDDDDDSMYAPNHAAGHPPYNTINRQTTGSTSTTSTSVGFETIRVESSFNSASTNPFDCVNDDNMSSMQRLGNSSNNPFATQNSADSF